MLPMWTETERSWFWVVYHFVRAASTCFLLGKFVLKVKFIHGNVPFNFIISLAANEESVDQVDTIKNLPQKPIHAMAFCKKNCCNL